MIIHPGGRSGLEYGLGETIRGCLPRVMTQAAAPRKYPCATCSRSYVKAEHLVRHQRTHTGEKPFPCPSCHREFSRQDSLARHQRRHGHGREVEENGGADLAVNSAQTEPIGVANTLAVNSITEGSNPNLVPADTTSDEVLQQLTWPDAEGFLQSILSNSLDYWAPNLETLPSQYVYGALDHRVDNTPSPWLPHSAEQQLQDGSDAIHSVSQIIADLSTNVTSEAQSNGLSTVFIDGCLHMFFDQFNPGFQVCHRPTFAFRDWTHPLLLNAIALGSLFLSQESHIAKGEALWKLAHVAVATSWHTLILHKAPNDHCNGVQLVRTALLGQTYAMLSGNPKLRLTAQVFHSLGFYWARECGMYKTKRTFDPVRGSESPRQVEEQWRLWAAEESQLRALLGHYILDGQLAQFANAPTCQRHASNPLPLPCSDRLFNASTADQWALELVTEPMENITFRQLFLLLFSEAPTLPQLLSVMGIKAVLEGVRSFVSEANSVSGDILGSPSRLEISKALGYLHGYISSAGHLSEADKLETLIRWHTICLDSACNSTVVCQDLCSLFTVQQNVFGQRKDDGETMELKGWGESSRARHALLHANAIRDKLSNLPFGRAQAIHVPLSTFAAAVIYCAFLLAGKSTVTFPDGLSWHSLMSIDLDNIQFDQNGDADTERLKCYLADWSFNGCAQTRNLLYDSNLFVTHLRQIAQPWGISLSLENVVQQLLSQCGTLI